MKEKCKLKKGDRIYECRYHEATMTEVVTDPELTVQGGNSHYWHWTARVVTSNSRNVAPGDIIEYGITEEAPGYGPCLYRQNIYEVGGAGAERLLPPFDTTRAAVVRRVAVSDDIEILGHVFHGLEDIRKYVEMSMYKRYTQGRSFEREPEATCEVHVGEMWMPYPCFDASDAANENRSYQNYIFRRRRITQDDMKMLSELPSGMNQRRVRDMMPAEALPLLYYEGDGGVMLLAT